MRLCPTSRLGAILFLAYSAWRPIPGLSAEPPGSSGAGGVLNQFTVTQFAGSGQNSIQAIATDPGGNTYIAGTTGSHDLPVKNAAQAQIGEARIMRSIDRGGTWAKVGNPPADVQIVVADPSLAQVLFAAGLAGIYKTIDSGQTWRTVYATRAATSGIASLVIDSGNHLRLAASFPTGALGLSLDGGETWTESPCTACGGQLLAGPGTLLAVNFGLFI